MVKADIGNWYIECLPEDGARISVLKYAGNNLLTPSISSFRKPENDYGEYELRPVYGYDDCFPTVERCIYPESKIECRDHGELYIQNWEVKKDISGLTCSTICPKHEVLFFRRLEFAGNKLTWYFEVKNRSDKTFPFLHVMHALMQPEKIIDVEVPEFVKVFDEIGSADVYLKDSKDINDHLLNLGKGKYKMLILSEVKHGNIRLVFKDGITLEIEYDPVIFPSLGIWWNNGWYPEEEGLRRTECAFEPIPGTCSNLEESFNDGIYLKVDPLKTWDWEISWSIN